MNIQINDKKKKDMFVSLFQILKNCSSVISATFSSDSLHIQGMDKAHICLFNVNIQKSWFDEYIIEQQTQISFDTNIFHLVISTKQDSHNMTIHFDGDDSINVDLVAQEHPPRYKNLGRQNK